MFGSIFGLILAMLFFYFGGGLQASPHVPLLATLFAIFAILYLFVPHLLNWWALTPLQKSEQNFTPHLIELYKKDWILNIGHLLFALFALFFIFSALDLLFLNLLEPRILLPIAIFLVGFSYDLFAFLNKRILSYLNPFQLSSMLTKQGHHYIQNDMEIELCDRMDALAEMSLKAIKRVSPSLCNSINNDLQQLISSFLIAQKSISHHEKDAETQALGISDKISYILFVGLSRLEMIFNQALDQRWEPVCSNIISNMGKIAIAAAKYDLTMTSYPLQHLGKLAESAEKKELAEVGSKAICILLEVGKEILTEIDITYMELQDTYLTLINQMQLISKEIFRQNKNMNIRILIQPFILLKELFTSEKMVNHPDTPAITSAIDRVIAEFEALESVMRTIPKIPVES